LSFKRQFIKPCQVVVSLASYGKTTVNRLETKNEIRKSTKAAPLEHIALVLERKPEIHR